MEMFPIREGHPIFVPPFFSATSVSDVLASRHQVKAGNQELVQRSNAYLVSWMERQRARAQILRAGRWFQNHVGKYFPYSLTSEYAGLIFLPIVRHDPKFDSAERNNTLTVSDVTGEINLSIPSFLLRKIVNDLTAKAGIPPINYDLIKKRDWRSDIVFIATYKDLTPLGHRLSRLTGEKDEENYTLLYVFNRYVSQRDEERVSFMKRFATILPKQLT